MIRLTGSPENDNLQKNMQIVTLSAAEGSIEYVINQLFLKIFSDKI
jgi:hypothetical protein